MKILAFIGQKGSGKSTAAKLLASLNPEIQNITLAETLKDAIRFVFHVPYDYIEDPILKETPFIEPIVIGKHEIFGVLYRFGLMPDDDDYRLHIGVKLKSPRNMMQYIGTEVLRRRDPDIHCKKAMAKMHDDGSDRIHLITDMRFVGEYEFFKNKFGDDFKAYYIQNNKAEQNIDNHQSELEVRSLKEKSIIIDNNGSLDDLKEHLLIAV